MGGEPRTALADRRASRRTARTRTSIRPIFRGGFDKLREAGVGAARRPHGAPTPRSSSATRSPARSIPTRVWTNAGARVGDVLVLTKPLGTGIIATAIKFGRAPRRSAGRGDRVDDAAEPGRGRGARRCPPGRCSACTDVTGFGARRPRDRDGRGERRHAGDRRRRRCRCSTARSSWPPESARGRCRSNQAHFGPRCRGARRDVIRPSIAWCCFDPADVRRPAGRASAGRGRPGGIAALGAGGRRAAESSAGSARAIRRGTAVRLTLDRPGLAPAMV